MNNANTKITLNLYDPVDVLSVVKVSDQIYPFHKGELHQIVFPKDAFNLESIKEIDSLKHKKGYFLALLEEENAKFIRVLREMTK